jgi:hypothetical protein
MEIAHLVEVVGNDRYVEQTLGISLSKDGTYRLEGTWSILVGWNENNKTVFNPSLGNLLMLTEHGGHGKNTHIHHRHTDEDEKG